LLPIFKNINHEIHETACGGREYISRKAAKSYAEKFMIAAEPQPFLSELCVLCGSNYSFENDYEYRLPAAD